MKTKLTKINKGTQRARRIVESYRITLARYGARSLHEAYASCSGAKEEAWSYCCRLCTEYEGKGLAVIGAGTYQFSAGFTFEEGGARFLCFITKCGDYRIELD